LRQEDWFTPEQMKIIADNTQKRLDAGYKTPVYIGHGPSHYFGYLDNIRCEKIHCLLYQADGSLDYEWTPTIIADVRDINESNKKKLLSGIIPYRSIGFTDRKDKKEFNEFLEDKVKIIPDTPGKRRTIPTGIRTLDAILGGGFAVGALNIIVGQPGSGKSMLAAQVVGKGQQIYEGKLLAGYLDSEESTTRERLYNLGVKYPPMTPYSDITVEKIFKFLEASFIENLVPVGNSL
jgi:hypothetical protein